MRGPRAVELGGVLGMPSNSCRIVGFLVGTYCRPERTGHDACGASATRVDRDRRV